MNEKFYITTPIYYVNDAPHIGHAYTTIAADVLARYHRAEGRDVHFLTGTDEHGIKIVKAAAEKGVSPQALADEVVVHFQNLWAKLNISNDDFIRTSQGRHEGRVQELIRRLVERDEIYLGKYEGWYDEGQEEFVTEFTAAQNDYKSAIDGRDLVRYSEQGWFFRLGKWIPKLIEHIESNPGFIQPVSRRNEVLSKLGQGVDDLSISRQSDKLGGWGIPMPNDPDHSVYVWVDALSNYITALGIPEIGDEFDGRAKAYWPADVQLIGKDILWFHAVYWPCLLMALEIAPPKTVFAHGWWTSEGKKMSKSLGNFISREVIDELCEEYSRDVFRYFVLREVPFGADGDFSGEAFGKRYNTELANDVGNLLSRTVNMIRRYFDSAVPAPQKRATEGVEAEFLAGPIEHLQADLPGIMDRCEFSEYVGAVLSLASATNRYIDATAPFKLARDPSHRERLGTILYTCAEAVRIVLSYLEPFMPEKAAEGLGQLGVCDGDEMTLSERGRFGLIEPGTKTVKSDPLFPRKI
ncbi:MAG: methionine--tRNA ligase [Planctomycetota bacterium]|nr:methionine--tRNA ligase [Planctomycetota bacterium]